MSTSTDIESEFIKVNRELDNRGIMPVKAPTLVPTQAGLDRLRFREFPFFKNQDFSKVVIVAGTNGKGSVCATLEALFTAAGERVGLYTSPHLVDATERIRVNQENIPKELFIDAYRAVKSTTEGMTLSHFEMITLMAVWVFGSGEPIKPVDRIILEVGMGGLWDATNAVPHSTCVITSLGFDHQAFLGSTLTEIAKNKFGIIPEPKSLGGKQALVVHQPFARELSSLVDETKKRTQGRWVECAPYKLSVERHGVTPRFFIETRWGKTELALLGKRGAENTALAMTVFSELGFDPSLYLSEISKVNWPGRMELFKNTPCPIYLSGDHNVPGVQSLLEILSHFQRNHVHFVAGIGKDKEAGEMLRELLQVPNSSIYLTVTPFKGRTIEEYGEFRNQAVGAWADPVAALNNAIKRAQSNDLIVVTGSLYLVGAVKARPISF